MVEFGQVTVELRQVMVEQTFRKNNFSSAALPNSLYGQVKVEFWQIIDEFWYKMVEFGQIIAEFVQIIAEFGQVKVEFGRKTVELGQTIVEFGQVEAEFGQKIIEFWQVKVEFGQAEVEFRQVSVEFGQVNPYRAGLLASCNTPGGGRSDPPTRMKTRVGRKLKFGINYLCYIPR